MPKLFNGGVRKAIYTETAYAFIYDENENPFAPNQTVIGAGKKYEDEFSFAASLQKNIFPIIKQALQQKTKDFYAVDVGFDDQGAPAGIQIYPKPNCSMSEKDLARLRILLSNIVAENNKNHTVISEGLFANKSKEQQNEKRYNTRTRSLR